MERGGWEEQECYFLASSASRFALGILSHKLEMLFLVLVHLSFESVFFKVLLALCFGS